MTTPTEHEPVLKKFTSYLSKIKEINADPYINSIILEFEKEAKSFIHVDDELLCNTLPPKSFEDQNTNKALILELEIVTDQQEKQIADLKNKILELEKLNNSGKIENMKLHQKLSDEEIKVKILTDKINSIESVKKLKKGTAEAIILLIKQEMMALTPAENRLAGWESKLEEVLEFVAKGNDKKISSQMQKLTEDLDILQAHLRK